VGIVADAIDVRAIAGSRREGMGLVLGDVLLDAAAEGLQEGVDPVDLGLELKSEADTTTGLLALEIDALPFVSHTGTACGLNAVTLDLAGLA
jgi:hypothetical protein